MLKRRVITVLWGFPLLVVVVWFDKPLPWFTVFIAIWGLLAAYEFYRLVVGVSGIRSLTVFGLLFTLLIVISPHCPSPFAAPLLVTLAVVLPLIWMVLRQRVEGAFAGWAWMVTGFLYVGWMLSFLVDLRLEAGRNWVFFALFTTFGSDTVAYFLGRALGRHRLAPQISPHKSWEGAIGGLLGAAAMSLLFTLSTPLQITLSIGQGIVLALLVSVFGQIGDLAESLLKRNTGVKESGNSIPGHGGFLDRMDSVVFAGVVVYLYYSFLIL